VQAQLPPCPDLGELLERAEAARERHERVGHLGEPCLALVHRRDDVEPREAMMRHLALDEMARHDADDLAPRRQRAVSERAHQPRIAAAVHDAPARLREQ
jgi:hypothetical protein